MRVIHTRPDRPTVEPAPSLFSPGAAWMRAAEVWAAERGATITRWFVDQRFVADGEEYSITWGDAGAWIVKKE